MAGRMTAVSTTPAKGQRGDQQMKSGNAAILRHVEDRRALRLFEGAGGEITYVGEFAVDTVQPFYTTDAPETGGGPVRKVIVFRLRPQVGRAAPADQPLFTRTPHHRDRRAC